MEVTGKIKVVNAEQQVSASFRKRELVVATEEQYPQFISINFVQDKCDLLNNYNVGEAVKVSINLRGREWVNPQGETKYFNDIQGWRIERLQAEQPAAMPPAEAFAPATDFKEEEHDDLPF
jgi:translation initiation factor IF-3